MANTRKNLIGSRDEYSRYYPGFTGIDFASDPADVATTRLAYAKNMWRDYKSEQGGAIETVPGYRLLRRFNSSTVNGIHDFIDSSGVRKIAAHVGTTLYVFDHEKRDSLAISGNVKSYTGLANHRSVSFLYQNVLYILDGTDYFKLTDTGLEKVSATPYVPISYSDGKEYEQRNMLSDKFINRYNLVNLDKYLVDAESLIDFTFEYDDVDLKATVTGFTPEASLKSGVLYIPRTVVHNAKTYRVTAIGDGAFAGNLAIREVIVHSDIVSIGDGAFAECRALEWLDLCTKEDGKASLRRIGEEAFEFCDHLRYVSIPSAEDGETVVGRGAFRNIGVEVGDEAYILLTKGVVLEGFSNGSSTPNKSTECPFIGSIGFYLCEEAGIKSNEMLEYIEDVAYGLYKNLTPQFKKYDGIYEIPNASPIIGTGSFSTTPLTFFGRGFTVYSIGSTYYAITVFTEAEINQKVKYDYRFTIYDAAIRVDDVMLDGHSVLAGLTETTFEPITRDEYIAELSVSTTDPSRLRNMVLTIHGTAEASTFNTIEGYVNAMDGNSGYKGSALEAITKCTICTVFDGRVFLSGNPALPNTVFYSHRDLTGFNNPAYFGILNYFNDGVSNSRIVSMMTTASSLCVLKGDTVQEGSIYYHVGSDTGIDIMPRIYPSQQGLAGLGCAGASCNFYDDPVFLSRRGLESIGKEQVNLERTIEHRSYNIDVRLCAESLSSARLAEWLGYLVIMCGGHMYLADSRQIFTHHTGVANYEFWYLEDIGQWQGQVDRYHTMTDDLMIDVGGDYVYLTELTVYTGGVHHPLKLADEKVYIEPGRQVRSGAYRNGNYVSGLTVSYIIGDDGEFILCDTDGEKIGGTYYEPCELCVVDDVLYFGTKGGGLYCFNTDKRGASVTVGGEVVTVDRDRIHDSFYSFDGRRIDSAVATKSDNCDIPNLTKQTRRNSFVIRAKSFRGSRIKARGRIGRGEEWDWREIDLPSSTASELDFSGLAFDRFTTQGRGSQICILREAFRKWYEKQIYLYSDGYCAPFGIYSMSFRYCIQGRIRE